MLADEVDEHTDHVPVHRELREGFVLERIGIALGGVVVVRTRVLGVGHGSILNGASQQCWL